MLIELADHFFDRRRALLKYIDSIVLSRNLALV